MEKTKKANSIRKLLTLMLTFVMVFTGMGIGSWGVDEAWADSIVHYYPTITYSGQDGSEKTVTLTDAQSIGTWSYMSPANDSDLFLLELPSGSEISRITIEELSDYTQEWEITGSLAYCTIEDQYPQISDITTNAGLLQKEQFINCAVNEAEDNYGYILSEDEFGLNALVNKIPTKDVEGYIVYCYVNDRQNNTIALPGIIIQYPMVGKDNENATKEIEEKIGKNIITKSENWYHEDDKFNGKEYNETGFWQDMQLTLAEAKNIVADADANENEKTEILSKLKKKSR